MVTIELLPGPLGARVDVDDLASLLYSPNGHEAGELRRAVHEYGVLIFGGPTSDLPIAAIAALLCGTESTAAAPPVIPVEVGATELTEWRKWRTTQSYLVEPPQLSVARALAVPTRGGQFQFADMRRALELIPADELQEMDGLELLHVQDRAEPGSGSASAVHPWIRPTTGPDRSLFMGAAASHIVGRNQDDSRQWFAEIEAQLSVHDVFLEHRWQPAQVVAWSHRFVLHRMLPFDADAESATFEFATC